VTATSVAATTVVIRLRVKLVNKVMVVFLLGTMGSML